MRDPGVDQPSRKMCCRTAMFQDPVTLSQSPPCQLLPTPYGRVSSTLKPKVCFEDHCQQPAYRPASHNCGCSTPPQCTNRQSSLASMSRQTTSLTVSWSLMYAPENCILLNSNARFQPDLQQFR